MFISYIKTSSYGRYVLPLVILYDRFFFVFFFIPPCFLKLPPGVSFIPQFRLLFNSKMADFYVIPNYWWKKVSPAYCHFKGSCSQLFDTISLPLRQNDSFSHNIFVNMQWHPCELLTMDHIEKYKPKIFAWFSCQLLWQMQNLSPRKIYFEVMYEY